MPTTDVDVKGQKVVSVLKYVLGIGAVALATPVIFLALKGVLGLLALGVAAGAGLAMIRLAPWFSQVITNVGIKLFIHEVQKNPIESMLSLYTEKTGEADEADKQIVEFESEVRGYNDQVKTFSRQYPEEAATFKDISERMVEALESMKQEQSNAREALADLSQRIKKAEAIYKMSLAAQRVASFSKSAEQKVFQEIKERVAFDAVQSQLNRSFAALNMAVSRRKQLTAPAPGKALLDTVISPISEAPQAAVKTIGKRVNS